MEEKERVKASLEIDKRLWNEFRKLCIDLEKKTGELIDEVMDVGVKEIKKKK